MALVKTYYKGGTFSREMANALREVDRLTPKIPLVYSQGGFNGTRVAASAGTHSGDAVDISVHGLSSSQVWEALRVLRMCGFAAWHRTPAQGFTPHIHAVPNGWGYPSAGAAGQAVSYRAGRNGLARNGRDDGPSGFRLRTWGGYLKANGLTVGGDGKTHPIGGRVSEVTAQSAKPKVVKTGIYAMGQGRPISFRVTERGMRSGKSSGNVKIVQTILQAQKVDGAPIYSGPLDGIYGPMTKAAVKKYQQLAFKTTNPKIADGWLGWSSFKKLVEWAGFVAKK